MPGSYQLHDVPPNPREQEGTDCGPDSLRMVLNYRNKNVARDSDIPRELNEINGRRGRGGGTTLSQMMRISAESYGLPAFTIHNCDINSLKAAIVNGWPPILTYKSTGKNYHAVVAVGYDDKRSVMMVHDPNYTRVRKIKYYDLGGTAKDGVQRFSCLLILPEGADEEFLMRGLGKYVPKRITSKLVVTSLIPM